MFDTSDLGNSPTYYHKEILQRSSAKGKTYCFSYDVGLRTWVLSSPGDDSMDQGYLGSARREAQDPELVVICYVELEEFLAVVGSGGVDVVNLRI